MISEFSPGLLKIIGKYTHFKIRNLHAHWKQWQNDKIPIKEIFDENTFEKKIKIGPDGTWEILNPPYVPTSPQYAPQIAAGPGGIIV